MHEATITIKKLWPPFKPGDKRTNIEDTNGNKYRVDVAYAAGFHDGDTVEIGYSDEKAPAEFGGKEYKLIKKMTHDHGQAPSKFNEFLPPKGVEVGPHLGMWEKEAFVALRSGMTSSQVIIMGIEARQAALEILKTDLSGKLPEPNDDLENTF